MTAQRFFLDPDLVHERKVEFPRDVAHQIRNVLRARVGDSVTVLDGTGCEYEVLIESLTPAVAGSIVAERKNEAEPARRVVVYQALLKGDKLEIVVQKCTEIGVAEFVLLETERTVAGPASPSRIKRLEAIIREAAEQSGRGKIPKLNETTTLVGALVQAKTAGEVVFAWESAHKRLTTTREATGVASLFIGPEGGFSAEEAALAAAAGARVVSLGGRILRSETAAIAASALLLLSQ